MVNKLIKYRLIDNFDEDQLSAKVWNNLLSTGSSDVIFMTWQWQKAWWEVFGHGKLLIITAEEDGKPIAIAPLFAVHGMIYFVGSGGSDYLDFIGDISDLDILKGMLYLAIDHVSGFIGFCFYHVPYSSVTASRLTNVAKKRGLQIYNEGELPSPRLELKDFPVHALESIRKKSLVRHENWFKRNGNLKVEHLKRSNEILPHLNFFFEQHINRWTHTPFPSLFIDPVQKVFYNRLLEELSGTGWLRFTCVKWQDRYIAFHFGFIYKGIFFWYKPTFEIALAKHSPGEVLLRQLLLQAHCEQAHTFDFGLGDEEFKKRFSTNTLLVRTWGLYPSSLINGKIS